ncbi:hypothetical protein Tco_1076331 [Tanacetum coccineum]
MKYTRSISARVVRITWDSILMMVGKSAYHMSRFKSMELMYVVLGLAVEELPCTFYLWCLNPALVFKNGTNITGAQ